MSDRGWFKHSPEHSLASKGIPTKNDRTPKTVTKTPTKHVQKQPTVKNSTNREYERIYQLFADYNYRYDLSPSVDNNGIFLKKNEAQEIIKRAVPNGCGTFNDSRIVQLSEVYESDATYLIRRDMDGGVIVVVKGTPRAHPGKIREWIGASISTLNADDTVSYKWTPAVTKEYKLTDEDRKLIQWAGETQSGKTDLSYTAWKRQR